MNISSEIVEPYASALMEVAKSHDLTDQLGADLRSLKGLLEGSPELRQFLANPIVSAQVKKSVIEQVVGETHPYLLNFLKLLVDKGRISFIEGIAEQYLAKLRQLRQTVLAQVTSTVELSDHQQQMVREKVLSMTGAREVELQTQIDPELLGGVIIKVGSQVIDSSLRSQLRRIGIRLTAG